jgi:hypothetical protein
MAKYKAAFMILLKKLFQAQGPELEKKFLLMLSAEEVSAYQTALPISWIPVQQSEKILLAAAAVLFPKDPQGVRRIGAEEAKDNLHGIYRTLLQIASVPRVLQQVAKIWRTYHDEGKAWAKQEPGKKEGYMIVEGYPSLPMTNREVLAGFIAATMEMAGLTNVRVKRDDTNPEAWKWVVTHD